MLQQSDQNIKEALEKIAKALAGLKYGQVVIQVAAGKVTFVDRIERERVE